MDVYLEMLLLYCFYDYLRIRLHSDGSIFYTFVLFACINGSFSLLTLIKKCLKFDSFFFVCLFILYMYNLFIIFNRMLLRVPYSSLNDS